VTTDQLAKQRAQGGRTVAGGSTLAVTRCIDHAEGRCGGHDHQAHGKQHRCALGDDKLALLHQPRFQVTGTQADLAVQRGQAVQPLDIQGQLQPVGLNARGVDEAHAVKMIRCALAESGDPNRKSGVNSTRGLPVFFRSAALPAYPRPGIPRRATLAVASLNQE